MFFLRARGNKELPAPTMPPMDPKVLRKILRGVKKAVHAAADHEVTLLFLSPTGDLPVPVRMTFSKGKRKCLPSASQLQVSSILKKFKGREKRSSSPSWDFVRLIN